MSRFHFSMVDSHGYLGDQSFDCEDEVFAAIDESNPKEKEGKEIPSPPKRARCAIDAIEDGGIEEMSAGKLDQFRKCCNFTLPLYHLNQLQI